MKHFLRKLLALVLVAVFAIPMAIQPALADPLPVGSRVTASTALKKITLSKSSVTITTQQSHQLRVTFSPATKRYPVVWTSSNTNVAKVDKNGVITPVAPGKCIITCTCLGKRATCTVTVKAANVAVKSVSVRASKVTLEVGDTWDSRAQVQPSNATNKKLTYSSSKKSVCTVSSSGKITAVSAGQAKITVKAANGKSASITVVVNKPRIEVSSKSLHLVVGDTTSVKSMLSVKGLDASKLRFSSSNKKVVMIDSKTGALRAVGKGRATVSVSCGSVKATLSVTVEPNRIFTKSYSYSGDGTIKDTFDIVVNQKGIESVHVTNTVTQSNYRHSKNVVLSKSSTCWVIRTEYVRTVTKTNTSKDGEFCLNGGAEVKGPVKGAEVSGKFGAEYCFASDSNSSSYTVTDSVSMKYYVYPDGTVTRVLE